jgi:hypothetical protein
MERTEGRGGGERAREGGGAGREWERNAASRGQVRRNIRGIAAATTAAAAAANIAAIAAAAFAAGSSAPRPPFPHQSIAGPVAGLDDGNRLARRRRPVERGLGYG